MSSLVDVAIEMYPLLINYSKKRLHKADAQDAVQDLFVDLIEFSQRVKSFQADHPRKYVMGAARRILIDYRYKSRRTKLAMAKFAVEFLQEHMTDPEQFELALDQAIAIIFKLHGKQREVMELKMLGWQDNEIARILNISEKMVGFHAFMARKVARRFR